MRKYAYSWGVRVIFGLIVLTFVFWGVGAGLSPGHPIATVDNQRIMTDQVDSQAQRLRQQLQQAYGANATAVLSHMNLREEALQMIIERMLIDSAARKLGLRISNAELEEDIASQSAFQVNGRFDFQAYQEVLRANNFEPAAYENDQREALLAQTLEKMVEQGVEISDDEARRLYDLQNEVISLAYIEVPYERFTAAIAPTPKQVADYFAAHGEEFREPDRIKIEYIEYDPANLAPGFNPTGKQIEDYYQRNRTTRFTHPDQMRARHILISVPKDSSPKVREEAKVRAESIAKQVRAGADFAKLALKYSDDSGTALQGGELGVFSRGQLVKQFEDGAFKLKPGQVAVVESPLGYHVVEVEALKPAHVDTLAEARPEIIIELRRQSGTRTADQALNSDLSAALNGESLSKLAASRGLTVAETPLFAAGEQIPGETIDPVIAQEAFKMQAGDVHAVSGKNPYLVRVVTREPSHIPPLKLIEARVREAYIRETAEEQARALGRKLLSQIKTVDDLKKVATANHLEVSSTPDFSRAGHNVPGIGDFAEVTDAAAMVSKVPGVIDHVLENGGNTYIFCLLERKPPSDQQWQQASADFKKELLKAQRQQVWTAYIDTLKSRAQIKVDANQLGASSEPSSM
jgi:peptidyl-prolyl cis-trans isomerase D